MFKLDAKSHMNCTEYDDQQILSSEPSLSSARCDWRVTIFTRSRLSMAIVSSNILRLVASLKCNCEGLYNVCTCTMRYCKFQHHAAWERVMWQDDSEKSHQSSSWQHQRHRRLQHLLCNGEAHSVSCALSSSLSLQTDIISFFHNTKKAQGSRTHQEKKKSAVFLRFQHHSVRSNEIVGLWVESFDQGDDVIYKNLIYICKLYKMLQQLSLGLG